MATMRYLSPSDRLACISLGEDVEKAKKIFNKRVNEGIEFRKAQEENVSLDVRENEVVIKWKDGIEWLQEHYYFDAEDNSIYKRF